MIPETVHQIWVNDDEPSADVLRSHATWQEHAPGFEQQLWTRSQLEKEFGAVEGTPAVRSNYYRIALLGKVGGWYVDGDTFAQPGVGDQLQAIGQRTHLAAATLEHQLVYDNTPIGAAAGLPLWDSLLSEPSRLFFRWNEWLARLPAITTLPGKRWNAAKPGPHVLVVHRRGTLTNGRPKPGVHIISRTHAAQAARRRGLILQERSDVQIVALRKSGHHAVLRWLASLLGNEVHHFNDCTAAEPGHFACRLQEATALPGKKPIERFCNFEDFDLAGLASHLIGDRKLLVIRNPYNCFASRIKASTRYAADWVNVELWKAHAREYLGQTSHLGPDVWRINFDWWHMNPEYRRAWAMRHVGHFDRDDREGVPEIGQSMFDGRAFDGRASAMDVQCRGSQLHDHPAMKPIFADRELLPLWDAIQVEGLQ